MILMLRLLTKNVPSYILALSGKALIGSCTALLFLGSSQTYLPKTLTIANTKPIVPDIIAIIDNIFLVFSFIVNHALSYSLKILEPSWHYFAIPTIIPFFPIKIDV